jgi:glutaredoxin
MFIVYSKPNCTYCTQSKALLHSKGLEYVEIMLDLGQPHIPDTEYVPLSDLEKLLPGVKSVPQIFERLGGAAPCTKHIGGFAELKIHLSLQP